MPDIHTFEPLWGEWYVVKQLGKGSFGTVYLAKKTELGKEYHSAIKHIKIPVDDHSADDLYSETDATRRQYYDEMLHTLMREIEINYRLKGNTNIVSYEEHKVFPRDNEPGYDVFIKMELLTGLTDYIKNTPVTVGDVTRLGSDICTALTVLQQERIVHRDIKPANIFVHSGGHYKLGDFGVARTLEKTVSDMSVKGTVAYMSPEVRRGGEGDYRVDVYSLGLVLYRLLNGNRAPFLPMPPASITYNSDMQAHKRRLQGEKLPAPAMADERLSAIILKACAYRPEDRYPDAAHFRSALMEYEASTPPDRLRSAVLGEKPNASGIKIPQLDLPSSPDPSTMTEAFEPGISPPPPPPPFPSSPPPPPFAPFSPSPPFPSPGADERAGAVSGFEKAAPGWMPDDGTVGIFRDTQKERPHQPAEDISEPTEYEPELTELELKPEFGFPEPVEPKTKSPAGGKMKWVLTIGLAAVIALILIIVLLPKNSDTADTPPPTPSTVTEPSPTLPATPAVTPTENPAVVLADNGLDAYLREQLELSPEEEITHELLEQIDALRIGTDTGFTVLTLEDLSLLPNLKILDLKGQQPDSFEPITKLDGLTTLNLGGCVLNDNEILNSLPAGIQKMDLRNAGLTSLEFASRLEQLSELYISGNSISDLTPLASLAQLSKLDAADNLISDWSPVDHVPVVYGKPEPPKPTEKPTEKPPVPSSRPATTPRPSTTVSGISLSRSSAVLEIGGVITLIATVSPDNAVNVSISWSSSNSSVATVDGSGRVTARGPGSATITASCGGYSASCTVSVS